MDKMVNPVKSKDKLIMLLFLVAAILFPRTAESQDYLLRNSVFGNGCAGTSDGGFSISGTVGQTATDVCQGPDNILQSGFWYTISLAEDENGTIAGSVSLISNSYPPGNIEEVEVTTGSTTVNPNPSGDYSLQLAPGIHDLTATLSGYTTVTLENIVVEASETTGDIDFTLIDWVPITGTQYSMVVMASVTLFSEIFDNSQCNQIAAFGPGGEIDCRGIAAWQEGADFWYFDVIGDILEEEISFRLFDTATEMIYECNETVPFQDNGLIGTPFDPFPLTVDPPLWVSDVSIGIENGNDVILSWSGSESQFRIYRSSNPYSDFTLLDSTSDTIYVDIGALAAGEYFYYITAYQSSARGNSTDE